MSAEDIRILVAGGFFMLLLLLRLEASRFGAAEYDEPGRKRDPLTRIAWYAIGLALLAAIYYIHPAPHDVLTLVAGHRTEVAIYAVILAVPGLLQAAGFAWLRYGYFRLPPAQAYPGAALNSVATAVIDEATFRGVLLGALLATGLPEGGCVLAATVVYVLATRLAAPGHHWYSLLLAGAMGLAFGWATVASGGIGAAIIGHAVTSFAVFVFTGHAGQVPLAGREPEDLERRTSWPEGWQDARRPLSPGRGAEPRNLSELPGRSGFKTRADPGAAPVRHSGGRMAWARSTSRAVVRPDDRPDGRRSL
jgi:membrane protease YdiL (CAAX protease family)